MKHMEAIWILLVIYQLKHFVADYLLQGKYMLGKFKTEGWVLPLLSHALVHGAFTFSIAYFYLGLRESIMLAFFDTYIHFLVDRVKASPNFLGKFRALSKTEMIRLIQLEAMCKVLENNGSDQSEKLKEIAEKRKSNTYFWWSLGVDQMAHHLTHYLIIYAIVTT